MSYAEDFGVDIDCSDIVEQDRLREKFWNLYKSMKKEKTTTAEEMAAAG